MKNIFKYTLLLVMALLASCSNHNQEVEPQKEEGILNLNCFTSIGVNTKAAPYIYAIEIRNTSDEIVFTAEDYTQITGGIKLKAGNYTVTATSGSLTSAASYTPCYTGSKEFEITTGNTTNVTINTSLANVKVTATIEQAVVDYFADFDLVVTNNASGILDFTEDKKIGYFTNSGTLTWTITIYNEDSSTRVLSGTISDTKVRDHYTLNFTLGGESIVDDFEIVVENQELEYNYDILISNNPIVRTHTLSSVNPWAKFIEVEGAWSSETKPEGLAFEYRIDGSDQWISVAATDGEDKKITATIAALTPTTKYFVRTATQTEKSAPMECTTETILALENSTMDTWTQSGKNWYANNVADETFWGSGNEGVTSIFAGGKPSNTAPTDDAVSGKAARLESIKVSVVGMAAGNLFTGKFDMNMGKPLDSPSFSQPYTGRPTSLSFWYKYSPVGLNSSKTPNDIKGQTDKCIAYIILGTWSGQIKSSAIKGRNTEGAVAYGEFSTDATVSEYTKQTINIEYLDKTTRPTRIIIVVSSSLRGEEYIGGLGSTMYIDEFELGWDLLTSNL